MELIKALWRGDISLAKTYWLFGFCVILLLKLTFLCFYSQPQILSTFIGQMFFFLLVLFAVVYNPFILIAIWRSANKSLSRYAIAAKFMVILGWLGYLGELGEFREIFLK